AAIASVTSTTCCSAAIAKTWATVRASRWTPSAITSTTMSPEAAASRAARAGPGSRWWIGRIPLNRWVAVGSAERPLSRRSSSRACAIARVIWALEPSVWPSEGTAPTSARASMTASASATSGATVMVASDPPASWASSRTRSASPSVMCSGFWAPRRSTERNGPSRWIAAISPSATRSARSATRSRRVAASAVTRDATRLVVPWRRCSRTAVSISSGEAASGKEAPPPPWQWRSTRPGRIRPSCSMVRSAPCCGACAAGPAQRRSPPEISSRASGTTPCSSTAVPRTASSASTAGEGGAGGVRISSPGARGRGAGPRGAAGRTGQEGGRGGEGPRGVWDAALLELGGAAHGELGVGGGGVRGGCCAHVFSRCSGARDGPAVRSEQTGLGVVDAAQRVVVEGHAVDAAIGGEHARLRLDGLGGEDAAHRGEQRVPVQQLEVAGELLDPVDLAAALDLDRDRASRLIAREDVHRADRGEVLAAHQRPALAEGVDVLREQGLEVGLDAVLLQARVDPEIVGGVLEHLDQAHPQPVTGLVVHDVPLFDPLALGVLARLLVAAARGGQRARRGHPVQRLVAAAVGMDQHAAVGLDDQQPRGEREMGGESTGVVDGATSNDETHPA